MSVQKITAAELAKKLAANEEVHLVDVRAEEKYNNERIEHDKINSKNIVKTEIFAMAEDETKTIDLPINQTHIISCTTGNSARKSAEILAEKGYDVLVLDGGLTAWKEFQNK